MRVIAAHNVRLGPNTSGLYEARVPSRLRGYSGRIGANTFHENISPKEIVDKARDVAKSFGGSIVFGVAPNGNAYYGVVWNSSSDIREMYELAAHEIKDRKYFDVEPRRAYRQIEIIEDDSRRMSNEFPSNSTLAFIRKCLEFASVNNTVKCVISDNTEGDKFIGLVGNEKEINKIAEIKLELN